jgi:hypothetical protein
MSLQEASPLSVGVVIDAPGQQHQQQHSAQAERAGRSAAMKQSSTLTMAVVSNFQAFMLLLDQHAMPQGVAICFTRQHVSSQQQLYHSARTAQAYFNACLRGCSYL